VRAVRGRLAQRVGEKGGVIIMQPAPVQRANQDETPPMISIRMRRCRSDERRAKPDRSEEEGARGRLQERRPGVPPHGDLEEVRVHDFLIKKLGQAVPYGIYNLAANAGWVSVGIDHDTAEFCVQTIRSWWHSTERRGKSVQTTGASSDGTLRKLVPKSHVVTGNTGIVIGYDIHHAVELIRSGNILGPEVK
jgi:Rhodopirellula transposase DDE domain